ncbi:MAG: hypothetical protein MUC40_10255, partial [Akkermansiaceae bacterium]|nr:hypothetical protein [Akkermansiaceae bacterium]
MYDRKTWIVLIVCGGLLAANLYFSAQTQRAKAAEQQRAQELRQANAAVEDKPVVTTKAELTIETPPPPTEEELVELRNDRVVYTLTNIGGGIKFAEFQHEFDVGSRTSRVRANRFGTGPIGAIAGSGETLDNIPYAYKADESI